MEKHDDTPAALRRRITGLFAQLNLRDQARLRHRLHRDAKSNDPEVLTKLAELLQDLAPRSITSVAEKLNCKLDPELPITARAVEIADAVKRSQVVIVCGETGSGKTTQLPKIARQCGFGRLGRIGCTQPRRLAATALAQRVAREMDTPLGEGVGYQVRFDNRTSPQTAVKFMTDGILLAETRRDPNLWQYDCIILDEVHERSLNIDFLLGFLHELLRRRRDLHLIISSATLESEKLAEFFGGAPVVKVEGRMFPVEDYYLAADPEAEITDQVWHGVEFLWKLPGDILVFLPGEREIRDCADFLTGKQLQNCEILPLFGRLSRADQQRVFSPGKLRRIVLSTNVAETSVTIPRISMVIDSGLVRLSRYNPRTRIQELPIEAISKASARQRRGRCGRLGNGVCLHLYSEEEFAAFADYTPPEIQRSALSGVLLQMADMGLPPIEKFPLVDPPSPSGIREGRESLNDLLAFTPEGKLSDEGKKLAALPLDPHLGKMLLAGARLGVLAEMLPLVAFLSIPDFRERPFEQEKAADTAHRSFADKASDFGTILNLYFAIENAAVSNNALRKFCEKNYLNYRRVREFRNLMEDLRTMCVELKLAEKIAAPDPQNLSFASIDRAILASLPRHLGVWEPENRLYHDYRGRKFTIFPGSALAGMKNPPPAILFFSLVETSRVYARTVTGIDPALLETVAPQVCTKTCDAPTFDESSGFVYAREKVTLGQIVIHPGRRCLYSKNFPAEAREIFIRDGLAAGKVTASRTWVEDFNAQLAALQLREIKLRHLNSQVDSALLASELEKTLPGNIASTADLVADFRRFRRDRSPDWRAVTPEAAPEFSAADYPDELRVDTEKFPITYVYDPGEENDGATLWTTAEKLEYLDNAMLDFAIPGFLVEKVAFYLRSLPKSLRRPFTPIDDTARLFVLAVQEQEVFSHAPLTEVLCSYLNDNFAADLTPDIFAAIAVPEYTVLKVALTDDRGNVKQILRKLPENPARRFQLNRYSPAAKNYSLNGCAAWAGNDAMPETLPLSADGKMRGFVAQTFDQGEFGRAVFRREAEARASHRQALRQLYRQNSPVVVKYCRSALRVSNEAKLSCFLSYPNWQEDAVNLVIERAFGGDLWQIRSAAQFDAAARNADGRAYADAVELAEQIDRYCREVRVLRGLVKKLPAPAPTAAAITQDLDFFFRPGFLRTPQLLSRYDRYFKALNLRLQRAIASPAKDERKGEEIFPYHECFYLTVDNVGELAPDSDLEKFALLLMEAKISVYAPEIKPLEKCSEPILAERWEAVRV